jgi:integrase
MRTYSSKAKASDEAERLEKLLIRDYVLISTNTCMRVGELRQLTWGDIERIETAYDADEKQIKLAHINVRPETSKVRRHRKIICRGGEYFERLKERQEFTGKDDLVFSSVNGTAKLSGHKWANHWNALMDGIGISRKEWKEERNLTWYSLRHFGITMRILAGVNVLDVSKLAGTSISHIENTYLKYQEEQMKTQAMKTFTFNSDGTIEHKE